MQLFVDSADVAEIADLAKAGFVDGVTTNPTLVAAAKGSMSAMIADICALVPGPVSAEVLATDLETMVGQGRMLTGIASNVVVKLPLTWDGLRACRVLADEGVSTNVTLCFSVNQALLAAKAGATFVSPFIGRFDDIGEDGVELIEDIRALYDVQDMHTRILAASIRSAHHVARVALAGADAATMPPKVLRALARHPLTDEGLHRFLSDAERAGVRIEAD